METWLPILKADYQLLENYHFQPDLFHLPIDFTVFKGEDDKWLSREEYGQWQRYTDRPLEFHEISGGHLLQESGKGQIINIIKETIGTYF